MWLGVDFIKPFTPCAGAKCAGNNVLCFIKNNYTPCALSQAYLCHTPRATRPTFMKEFLSIALCASYFCAMHSAPKKASLFVPRPKLNLRHAPKIFAPRAQLLWNRPQMCLVIKWSQKCKSRMGWFFCHLSPFDYHTLKFLEFWWIQIFNLQRQIIL